MTKHPGRFKVWLTVFIAAATFFFPRCARVNVPVIQPPVLDLKVWYNDTIDPQFFYFVAFQFGGTGSDGPLPEVSGSRRARDWTHYILYTGNSLLTPTPKFFFRKIDPPNDEAAILFAPTRQLFQETFYLDARVYSEPVDGQPRTQNGLEFVFDLQKFLEGNTRFDMTFLTATRGVDQVSNPPSPPEPGQVIDAYDTIYIRVDTLTRGTLIGERFAPQERKDDVPPGFADTDIVGWELRVR
jgi:hypothetical protein